MSNILINRCSHFYWGLFPKLEDWTLLLHIVMLSWRNRVSPSPAVASGGAAGVSLTTCSAGLANIHLTIDSIAAGVAALRRLVLWHDKEISLMPCLQWFFNRGLEIRLRQNFGPHTNYFLYIEAEASFIIPPLTAADFTDLKAAQQACLVVAQAQA